MDEFWSKNSKSYEDSDVTLSKIVERFENFFTSGRSVSMLKTIDDEDCGVLEEDSNSILNEVPIYEYFALLINSDQRFKSYLEESMGRLNELEKEQNSKNPTKVKESEMWAKLVDGSKCSEKGANSGFAFNFADESSDEE